VHAEERPVQKLAADLKKTNRSYVWAYATNQFCETAAIVYAFGNRRACKHACNFLNGWKGKLVCNDFGIYKASFKLGGTEIGCIAQDRSKFFVLPATNKSKLVEQALRYIQLLYEIKSKVRDLEPYSLHRIQQQKAAPFMARLHAWMIGHPDLVPEGSAISIAPYYSLKRSEAQSSDLDDGAVPVDDNWVENHIRQ